MYCHFCHDKGLRPIVYYETYAIARITFFNGVIQIDIRPTDDYDYALKYGFLKCARCGNKFLTEEYDE